MKNTPPTKFNLWTSYCFFYKSLVPLMAALLSGLFPFGDGVRGGGALYAQGEANFWYFGDHAGLDFNGGAPIAVTNNQFYTNEGSASISDAGGNLLFYTNGIQVWNSIHVQMPNGSGLMGNLSTTQSAVIVHKPGSATIYYIFTADAFGGANGIRYTEVDMSLNAGLGDVTTNKNIPLNTPSCEKLAAVRHCNNQDIWVVTHDVNSNGFSAYLVTAAGVNPAAFLSNAGPVVAAGDELGYLKASPNGKKIASSTSSLNFTRFELYDFNASTGMVSNAISFPALGTFGSYGVEFSPNGTKLYGSISSPPNIYQFNLCAGSNAAIANSGVLIGTYAVSPYAGALQLGPDKKIYLARPGTTWLGVINSPNTLGAGCNYVDNGVSLAGQNSRIGLPNFISSYLKPPPSPFTVNVNCLTGTFTAPTVNLTNCSGSGNAITSLLWNFGDPASGANNTSSNNNPAHTFTGAGTYTVTLVLNYACGSDTIKQNVSIINTLSVSASSTPAGCNSSTGSATANPSGGTGTLTYSWTPSGGNNATATGLAAGNYTITVTDASGCANTQTIAVTSVSSLSVSTSSTQAGCSSATGTATATPIGGTGALTYSWSPSGGNNANATGLTAGNYTVIVTDASGCANTQTIAVTSVNTLSITTSSTQAGCASATGSATAIPSGGTGTLTYSWTPSGGNSATATGLAVGNYTVMVTDANNCSKTQTVSVTSASTLSVSISSTQAGCASATGTATANPNGGTGTLTYSWTPSGGNNATATGLAAGNYTVTVTDSNTCTQTQTVTVISVNTLTVNTSSTSAACNSATGTATANPTGGTGTLTYSWSPSGGNNATATGLVAGNYTATITDVNGCTKTQTVTVTSANTLSVTASSTPTSCNAATGTATVTPIGGTGALTYSWSPSGGTNANASGLAAGNYSVLVTDANGCTQTQTVTVTSSNAPTVTLASQANILCYGQCTGSAAVAAAGGNGPYTYLWNPAATASASVTGLCAGNYVVTVTDNAGCISTQTVTITQPSALSVLPNATQTNCNASTGSAAAAVAGGSAPYTYLWNPTAAATATATGLYAGSYTVTVTDANGCSSDTSVDVTEIVCPCPATLNLTLPNAFSPNNDGENDEFCLQGGLPAGQAGIQDCIKKLNVIIYNRWGEKVFESDDKNFCWDGFYKDKLQNSAVFVFYLEAMLTSGKEIKKKGNVSILR